VRVGELTAQAVLVSGHDDDVKVGVAERLAFTFERVGIS